MDALKGAPSSRMFLQQTQTLPPNRSALRENRHLIQSPRGPRLYNGLDQLNADAA